MRNTEPPMRDWIASRAEARDAVVETGVNDVVASRQAAAQRRAVGRSICPSSRVEVNEFGVMLNRGGCSNACPRWFGWSGRMPDADMVTERNARRKAGRAGQSSRSRLPGEPALPSIDLGSATLDMSRVAPGKQAATPPVQHQLHPPAIVVVFVEQLEEPAEGDLLSTEPGRTRGDASSRRPKGGQVALNWTASERDAFPLQEITHYSLWRAVDSVPAAAGAAPAVSGVNARGEIVSLADVGPDFSGPAYRVQRTATVVYYWEFAGTQDAIAAPGYSALVPTRQDSTGTDPAKHYFQVVAHTSNAQVFYASPPDSAYSVDNIGPAAPVALAAMRAGDAMVDLDWSPSGANEPDFKEYWVYRSETAGFPADPAHFLKAAPDTSTTDDSADPDKEWHYKVVAVDVHGNPSGESNEAWVQIVTAVEDGFPKVPSLVLLPNSPNPFGARTDLRFGLPATMGVTVEVFDVAGHRVVRRELPPMAAGWQRFTFDGRDDAGAPLPSGLYFYRVSGSGSRAAGMTTTRKMIIAR